MFLTPFIDFGEPIEKWFGLSVQKGADDSDSEADIEDGRREVVSSTAASSTTASAVVPPPPRIRIVGTSDRLKLVSATDRGFTLAGSGIALGSGPIEQSKAYFEIFVEEENTMLSVGAIGKQPSSVLAEGWQVLSRTPNAISVSVGTFGPGDVIGVVIDISDFPPSISAFTSNDRLIKSTSLSVRGDLWPAVEISKGSATVIFNREHLSHLSTQRISRGIEALMLSRSIM